MPYPKIPDWWVGPEKPRTIPKNKNVVEQYLCSRCLHPPDKCKCRCFPPHALIWVDKKLQDIITMLNDKNYETSSCCEGHGGWVYISFVKDYGFDTLALPEGYGYSRSRHCLLAYTMLENEDYYIQKLREWVERLPNFSVKKFKAHELW